MDHRRTRGAATRSDVPAQSSPSELGWDDGLYRSESGAAPDAESSRPADPQDASGSGHRRGGTRSRKAPKGPKSRKRRVLRWIGIGTAVAILGTAGAGWAYYEHLNANIKKDELNLSDSKLSKSQANADGQTPLNILLLGSDSRNSDENVKLGGARDTRGEKPRADVEMLLHLSADRTNMTVISIPRDTRVTIPKCTDPHDGTVYKKSEDIINASLTHGGPGCTVATWEEMTGISIDHFMMVDFAGVVKMADAIGGVPVCVDKNIYDKQSGLRLKAGRTTVMGEQALQWLRTRHGFEDGTDLGRTHAQHMYMNSMIRELKKGAKLTDPGQLTGLAEAATKSVTVDTGLGTVKKLYDLGNELKKVPSNRITMTTMPWNWDPTNKAHVIPKPGDAEKLFALVRADNPADGKAKEPAPGAAASSSPADPAAPTGEIAVTVRNGTGTASRAAVSGRAKVIAGRLNALGFTKAVADTSPQTQADTTVSYPSASLKGDAQAVAKALGLPDSAVRVSKSVTTVTLVVGSDWRTGTSYPKTAGSSGTAGSGTPNKAPDTSSALNGADTSACMKVNTFPGAHYVW
ncbi:LCP family protein [Streptomyces sp. H10-C2]|uniref:LCP family protein n=1 Tax=unclassified Streptomyces TaxID=2593676 RepID=UPI0024BB8DC1|nr:MULTISPECIES: LCP family protein [unclassified Streptomyces]MDJ0341268.1 LCP family protein [Streptomyces sp. PH10-H1]MDJ0370863.1 LCP family protein [Streptomyces sp. H10-C2]